MSFEDNGREILIPTVAHDGSRLLSEEEAIDQYRTTGRHLGIFDNPRNATAYAVQLHNDYANGKIPGYKADNSKGPDDLVSLLKPAGVLLGKAGEKVGKAVPGLLQKLAGRTNAR
jgi:hypothetical protein